MSGIKTKLKKYQLKPGVQANLESRFKNNPEKAFIFKNGKQHPLKNMTDEVVEEMYKSKGVLSSAIFEEVSQAKSASTSSKS